MRPHFLRCLGKPQIERPSIPAQIFWAFLMLALCVATALLAGLFMLAKPMLGFVLACFSLFCAGRFAQVADRILTSIQFRRNS